MDVLWKADALRDKAFRNIADEIKFRTDFGQPIVAFNLQPRQHKSIVETEVYSHTAPVTVNPPHWGAPYAAKNINVADKGQGNVATVLVRDGNGISYPAQIVWTKLTPPGYTSKIRFVTDNIPAGGYKTFYIDVSKQGEDNSPLAFTDRTTAAEFYKTFETDYYSVTFNMKSGNICSLKDKSTGKEFVKQGEELNKLRVYLEDKSGGMKSWAISKIVDIEEVTNTESVRIAETGPVRACIETVKKWGKSRFVIRTFVYKSYPRIEYEMEAYWLETGDYMNNSPMLRAIFPLNYNNPRLFCQTPFDVTERPIDGFVNGQKATLSQSSQSETYGIKPEMNDGQEVPALKWVDVTDGQTGFALLNKTKYGHSVHNGDLRLTLFRAAGDPDIFPNIGKFNVHYAIYPHKDNWTNGVWTEGEDFNIPVYATEPPSSALGKSHATRPEESLFYSISADNVELSGMKQSEDDTQIIVRFVETQGNSTEVDFYMPLLGTKTATRLNLLEYPLKTIDAGKPSLKNGKLNFIIQPHEIVTIGIKQ